MRVDQRVGVVGLGTVGVQEITLWRRAGYPTVGYDVSPGQLRAFRSAAIDGMGPQPLISGDARDLNDCSVLILCLPNLDSDGRLSADAFDHFSREVQHLSKTERLIILASTIPIGFSREFARQLGSQGALLAHAPERFDPGRGTGLGDIPRVLGGTSARALDWAADLYTSAQVAVHRVEPIEVAEASKLLENSFRLVNIAFINEFAELCRHVGIAAAEVVAAAATKPFAFMSHSPGAGAGGRCIPIVPRYLLQAADTHGLELPILQAALAANEQLAERVSAQLRKLLAKGSGRRNVLVAGATYKPDYPDARGSAALRLALGLRAEYDVVVVDPIIDRSALPADLELRRDIPSGEFFDAVVIALKHRDTDVVALRRLSRICIDLVRGEVEGSRPALRRTGSRQLGGSGTGDIDVKRLERL